MHIVRVMIKGFKSYVDADVNTPFDRGLNVVLGKTGCGKTNLLKALFYVLSLKTTIKQKDRKSLIHDHAPYAVIELTLDNSDRSLSFDSDEIRVRRTIGFRRCQYFLNGKRASVGAVGLLLKQGGIPINKHYYAREYKINDMTQQGKVKRWEHMIKKFINTLPQKDGPKNSLHPLLRRFRGGLNPKASRGRNQAKSCSMSDREVNKLYYTYYKGLKNAFSEIYQKLVPGGEAYLRFDGDTHSTFFPFGGSTILNGISVVVKPRADKTYRSIEGSSYQEQIMGVLALRFAYMKMDPSSIYIYDNIEQKTLDPAHRRVVMQYLLEQAETAQVFVLAMTDEFASYSDSLFMTHGGYCDTRVKKVTLEEARQQRLWLAWYEYDE